jgi:hypothetical protein
MFYEADDPELLELKTPKDFSAVLRMTKFTGIPLGIFD